MKYMKSGVLVLTSMLFFIACSDEAGLYKASQGLEYVCSSGKEGVTDVYGRYECEDGDDVTFFLDSVEIKTITAKKDDAITPHKLFPDNDMDANELAKLLDTSEKDTKVHESVVEDTLANTGNLNKSDISKKVHSHTASGEASTSDDITSKKSSTQNKKVDSKDDANMEIVDDVYPMYRYRAWGMGGDATYSKAQVVFDSKVYTIVAFSQKNIEQLNASTAGDVTTIIANVEKDGLVKQIQLTLSQDYLGTNIVLKAYDSPNTFNTTSLRGFSSQNMLADSGTYIDIGTFNIQ